MKLNLSKFRKISSDDNISTLQHPAGHTFRVVHSALSPANLKELKSLPLHPIEKTPAKLADGGDTTDLGLNPDEVNKFEQGFNPKAEGGEIEDPKEQKPTQTLGEPRKAYADGTPDAPVASDDAAPEKPFDPIVDARDAVVGALDSAVNSPDATTMPRDTQGNIIPPLMTATQPLSPEQVAEAKAPEDAPSSQSEAPAATQAGIDNSPQVPGQGALQSDINQITQGEKQEQGATQQAAQANVGSADTLQGKLGDLAGSYSKNVQDLQQKSADMLKALSAKEIDPNHYLNNMSTGHRITSALGMIIGGAGAGLSHQQNLAAQFLDKQIDNDIAAQAANINNKKSLLGFNLEQTQNLNAATSLSKGMIYDMYASQLEKNKNQAIAGLPGKPGLAEANYNKAVGDLKMKAFQQLQQAALFQTLQQHSSQNTPRQPGVDQQRFNLMERVGLIPKEDAATANKESQKYEENESLRTEWQNQFNHLNKQALAGALHPGDRASALNDVAGRIQHISEGRFNEDQAKALASTYLPSPGDAASTLANKRVRAQAFFDTQGQTPTLDRYGLVNKTNHNPVVTHVNGGQYQLGNDGQYHRVK